MPRKPSQADRLLKLLSDGERHSTVEILHVVYDLTSDKGIGRIASRVSELRKRGHDIECSRGVGSVWHYQFKNPPKPAPRMVWKEVMIGGVPHMRQVPASG